MSEDILLESISPFFIVTNLIESIEFYNQKLGFKTDLLIPEDDPFFGIVSRDNLRILLKHITDDIHPIPNKPVMSGRALGCFILVSDPDTLFKEYQSYGLEFHQPLADTDLN